MGKKVLTEDMENFIFKNYNLMTRKDIADYLGINVKIVHSFCHRKKLGPVKLYKGPNLDLTKKEIEIAELLVKGWSNKEIQEKLCITLTTVKTHLNNIYNKYNLSGYPEIGSGCLRLRFVLEYLRRNNKLID